MEGEVEESGEHNVVEEEEEGGEQDMGIYMRSVSVLGWDVGYTVKIPIRMKEFPRVKPKVTPEGEGVYLTVYTVSSANIDS